MKIINQGHEILDCPASACKVIERAARTCYKSEDRIKNGSDVAMVSRLLKSGHGAMLEFADITARLITNRGISHEIVRHRVGFSYAQESTRYVKYDGDMEFIRPTNLVEWNRASIGWKVAMEAAEEKYVFLLGQGWKAQDARGVLPNDLKTEIVVKGNIRAWRNFFKLRCAKAAHPQMVELSKGLLADMARLVPVVFDDLAGKYGVADG
jgi:thymidylate synthase (FAD)